MKKYKSHSLKEYCDILSGKTPVPGGGSAAALTAALGTALISMVARYSIGKQTNKKDARKMEGVLKKSETIRKRLLDCVDLDAEAYLKVVKARKKSPRQKKAARKAARGVPQEVCRLCYTAIALTPFLVTRGNPHLASDIEVAIELLLAAFQSAKINVVINQP